VTLALAQTSKTSSHRLRPRAAAPRSGGRRAAALAAIFDPEVAAGRPACRPVAYDHRPGQGGSAAASAARLRGWNPAAS
jgi:hypothetical protein